MKIVNDPKGSPVFISGSQYPQLCDQHPAVVPLESGEAGGGCVIPYGSYGSSLTTCTVSPIQLSAAHSLALLTTWKAPCPDNCFLSSLLKSSGLFVCQEKKKKNVKKTSFHVKAARALNLMFPPQLSVRCFCTQTAASTRLQGCESFGGETYCFSDVEV